MSTMDFHLRQCRARARAIERLARELVTHASLAHEEGASWESVARSCEGRYPNGSPDALGNMVPGGRSSTSVREFVLARSSR